MSKKLLILIAMFPSVAFCYDFGQWSIINQEIYIPQEAYTYTTECPNTYAYDDDFYCDYDATSSEVYFSIRQNDLGYVSVFISYDNKEFSMVFESNVPLDCGADFCANPKLSSSLSWVKNPKSSDWETTTYDFKYTQGKVERSFTLNGKRE